MRTKLFKIAHILRCSVLGEYSRVTMLKKMFQLPTMRVGPLVKWLSRYSAQSIFVCITFFTLWVPHRYTHLQLCTYILGFPSIVNFSSFRLCFLVASFFSLVQYSLLISSSFIPWDLFSFSFTATTDFISVILSTIDWQWCGMYCRLDKKFRPLWWLLYHLWCPSFQIVRWVWTFTESCCMQWMQI